MTAVSPNINGTQQQPPSASQDTSSSSVVESTGGVSGSGSSSLHPMQQQQQQQPLPPHLHHNQQHHHHQQQPHPHPPTVPYTPQYPIVPAHMVYQGYPGTAHHPGTYMAATPHFTPAPPGAYTMYPPNDNSTSTNSSNPTTGLLLGHPHSNNHSSITNNKLPLRGSSPNYHGPTSMSSQLNPPNSNSTSTLAVGSAPIVDPALKTTLWMGIDNWMDENYIRSLWMNAAGVEVTVKMIRDRYTGNPANYCFVDFPSYEQALQCVKLDNTPVPTLPETVWRLNWASGGGIHDTKAPEYSIFVGDLGIDVTDDILLTAFISRYPSTKSAKVVMDPATGNSRGFGFVRFTSEDDQQRSLIEMNGIPIGQRAIRVGNATPKHRHGPGAHSHSASHHLHSHPSQSLPPPHLNNHRNFHPTHNHMNNNPYGSGSGNLNPMYPSNNSNNNMQAVVSASSVSTDPTNTTVFIGGLSHPVSDDEIRSLFASQGEITLVKIPPGKNCAFVSYARRESAEKAIAELNGFTLGNNKVRLSWGRPNHNNIQTSHSVTHHSSHPHHHYHPQQQQQQQHGGPSYLQSSGGNRQHHMHSGGPGLMSGTSGTTHGMNHFAAPGGVSSSSLGGGMSHHYNQGHHNHHGGIPGSAGFNAGGGNNGSNPLSYVTTNQSSATPYGSVPPNAYATAGAQGGMYPLPLSSNDNNNPLPYGGSAGGYVGNVSGPTAGSGSTYSSYPVSGNPGMSVPSSNPTDAVVNSEVSH